MTAKKRKKRYGTLGVSTVSFFLTRETRPRKRRTTISVIAGSGFGFLTVCRVRWDSFEEQGC